VARRPAALPLLLEVGCEELPPTAVAPALAQLAHDAATALREARLEGGAPRTTGTVRRLVLTVDGVPHRQADRVTAVRGPAARIAFDASGVPTQAAAGFARAQGVPVDALRVREVDGGRYVVAEVREAGRASASVLAEVLPRVVAGLAFPKTMRWQASGFRFGRPIRWVVALLGRRVIPLEIAGVRAGRKTRGHRFLAPAALTLPDAGAYGPVVHRGHVVLAPRDRRTRIADAAAALAREVRGRPVLDPDLLEELVWSTEHPTPLRGAFDAALAAVLPREVVLVTLQHHQKSFGVEDRGGRVLPAFIAVRDGGTAHLASVRTGHEWVVGARLEDARFFLEEDRRRGFASREPELARLAYAAGLGSMADHVDRLRRLSDWLAQVVRLGHDDRATLARAASLCKIDLVTALVREFPELQGVIGRIYALEAGESGAVAVAIEQHYWPKSAGASLPDGVPAALLAVADRALLLAGALLVGLEPTGSQDPYGLRRAASGLGAILQAHGLGVGLRDLFAASASRYEAPADARDRAGAACVEFVLQRLRTALVDQGMAYDGVDAVFAAGGDIVADLVARVRALQAVRADPVMPRLATGFARASRILSQAAPAEQVDPGLYDTATERELHAAWEGVDAAVGRAAAAGRYPEALAALARLADPIDRFFDGVLVMAPDAAVRANRLALLRAVTRTFLRVADLGKLAG
jgi:tetrameric-type glycyl-tRNA synthetase beta subunit